MGAWQARYPRQASAPKSLAKYFGNSDCFRGGKGKGKGQVRQTLRRCQSPRSLPAPAFLRLIQLSVAELGDTETMQKTDAASILGQAARDGLSIFPNIPPNRGASDIITVNAQGDRLFECVASPVVTRIGQIKAPRNKAPSQGCPA